MHSKRQKHLSEFQRVLYPFINSGDLFDLSISPSAQNTVSIFHLRFRDNFGMNFKYLFLIHFKSNFHQNLGTCIENYSLFIGIIFGGNIAFIALHNFHGL